MLTLSKIAKLANVSISTASKAFSMSPEVNEQTRDAIFDIAKKHGCFKKFFNAKYPKLVIAVICPEFESLHYTSMLSHLQTILEKRDCEICVATTQFSKNRESELVDYYSRYARVDGMIFIDSILGREADSDIPTVYIGHAKENSVRVFMKKRPALEAAIDYFISHGVTDIGFIGEHLTVSKQNIFADIMTEKLGGFNQNYIGVGERFADGAYATTQALIDKGCVPRALVCAYDYLAIGTVRCLFDNGYRVPEDVLVLGMDDISEAKYLIPALSSIDSDSFKVCDAAATTLMNIIMEKPYQRETVIESTLHLRKSTELCND